MEKSRKKNWRKQKRIAEKRFLCAWTEREKETKTFETWYNKNSDKYMNVCNIYVTFIVWKINGFCTLCSWADNNERDQKKKEKSKKWENLESQYVIET